ncbi:MAG: Ti-type conjugative transfer relaxase TraA [Alphaproteobacteria bacterium]|nr:Ti-type conjugative transfer relaxase TraA [Alphaproteobacteria bacterium]
MAVPHFSVGIVARGSGRSAVLSAAYRHCARMEFEREARVVDYRAKRGLLHEEFVIPADAPDWLSSMVAEHTVSEASEAFWNKIEVFEKRADAQLAKDVTIALPIELSAAQNIELVRDFVARHVTDHRMVADWVFHDVPGNPHIHLMTSLRPLTDDGFGSKKVAMSGADGQVLRNASGKIAYGLWAGGPKDFTAFRDGWFACQNRHLALAGLDLTIDGRSFERRGIALTPTVHVGVDTKALERKAAFGSRVADEEAALRRIELQEERRRENARRIGGNPQIVLDLITREKSVFDERDVAKILHRYIDDAGLFQSLMARILQSPETLRLDRERLDLATGLHSPAKYTTRALIRLEAVMVNQAIWLSQRTSHAVRKPILERVFLQHQHLSAEQRIAIQHVAGGERIAAVIGRAGAGKTTMMKAARAAWEAAGYRVVGGALAGKAAEGLEKEAGIASRTLSSWELHWDKGRRQLDDRTVFVLDEAGMVSSRQMALFVEAVTKTGAKLVLIGDPEQLQPIEAGAAFRTITEHIGYAELETIYRQRVHWMRDASLELARGNTAKAISSYQSHGKVIGTESKAEAIARLIDDWSRDFDPAKSTLILSHLRRDVRVLNEHARARLIERGLIAPGFAFMTGDGVRHFAAGDQIVFLKNEGSIGVKNGMLGKVVEAATGRIVVAIGERDDRVLVTVEQRFYNNIDLGYATTVHKAQGATVDRVQVLASLSLDRHLTYVAMTRHRDDLSVYYGRRSFTKAGGLVEIFSRRNSKETTLDYAGGRLYGQALRFAASRGLNIVHVGRTLIRGRIEWTLGQRKTIADLGGRLAGIAAKLGLARHHSKTTTTGHELAKPMVAGVTTHLKSIEDAVEERLAVDAQLKSRWADISMRFVQVYAEPQAAFRQVNVEAMLRNNAAATTTLTRLASMPECFGALKGKAGVFASRPAKLERELAHKNVRPLVEGLFDYLRVRQEAAGRARSEEMAMRTRAAVEIPALSAKARSLLLQARDAIDGNDLPKAQGYINSDSAITEEVKAFARAVAERFGDRSLLVLDASTINGSTFARLTSDMNSSLRHQVAQAWIMMRTAQQVTVHQQRLIAIKHKEALQPRQNQGLALK